VNEPLREDLILADLTPVIKIVAKALPYSTQAEGIARLSNIDARFQQGQANAKELWTPVFEAALKTPSKALPSLMMNIREDLGEDERTQFDSALRMLRLSCVLRVTGAANSQLGNQADDLLAASTVPEMTTAAESLRLTALNVRRLLMRPLFTATFVQFDPSVPDPESRRMELADLAVDVVTAADYLLSLLGGPALASTQLVLATEAGTDHGHGSSDDEALDRLTRRRLDARGSAVRLGMRLLAGLLKDVAIG
jgi:hypothetical protein